jgi:iron complex outermembrane receptor protein
MACNTPILLRRSTLASFILVALGAATAHAAAPTGSVQPPDTAAPTPAPAAAPSDGAQLTGNAQAKSATATPPAKADFTLDRVVVRGLVATSLPTRIPTTVEGITHVEIVDRINATDAQDALKYLPSLLMR